MSTRIEDLEPTIQPAARTFLSLIKIPYVVTSTLRTQDEQAALYAQGRSKLDVVNSLRAKAHMRPIGDKENSYIVTKLDGVIRKSNHQSGRALDVVPADVNGNPTWPGAMDVRWDAISKAGETAGFEWGGRWDWPDLPHFQMKE